MIQPLVSRPPYGEGQSRTPTAVAELPEGGPTDKGLPVDDALPGHKTFKKPEDDTSTHPKKDEPVDRIDGGYSIPKDRDRVDTDEDAKDDGPPSYMGLGPKDKDYSKTPYPYRDDKPNWHNAAGTSPSTVARSVVALYQLQTAPEAFFPANQGVRVARTLSEVLSGLDAEIQKRSKDVKVNLRRADIPNMRWFFNVKGNSSYVVRIKASRPKPNVTKMSKLDLHMACSCPAWRWQGPEYHAKQDGYQDPKTKLQGTASTPDIRDPERDNRVCKHMAAVLGFVQNWEVPIKSRKKQAVAQAMQKRACNVCVANLALEPGDWELGHRVAWEGAPEAVYLRAVGEAEGEAQYQIRKEGESWPEVWTASDDLAGSLRVWGFDVPWDIVPEMTKVWLQT